MSLGSNIRRLREDKGLTQEQIAEWMDVSFQAVSSWERDEYKPDLEKLLKLAEVLEVSLSALAEENRKIFRTKEAIKCIDRCNNLTTMSWGLSRDRIYRMISETEKYYPRLLKTIKSTVEYDDAAWLLQYQIESMLDIYKRLM